MGMTGYIDKRLKRTGERIIYRTHLSWIPMFLTAVPLLWFICILAGAVMGITGNFGYAMLVVFGGVVLIALSKVPSIMKNIGTDIVVTDRRLHTKEGILDVNNDRETPLTNIDDTIADPTIIGRLFGYGDVMVHTFGGGHGNGDNFTFRNVTDPHELVAVINETRDGLATGNPNPYATFQQQQEARSQSGMASGRQGFFSRR